MGIAGIELVVPQRLQRTESTDGTTSSSPSLVMNSLPAIRAASTPEHERPSFITPPHRIMCLSLVSTATRPLGSVYATPLGCYLYSPCSYHVRMEACRRAGSVERRLLHFKWAKRRLHSALLPPLEISTI